MLGLIITTTIIVYVATTIINNFICIASYLQNKNYVQMHLYCNDVQGWIQGLEKEGSKVIYEAPKARHEA